MWITYAYNLIITALTIIIIITTTTITRLSSNVSDVFCQKLQQDKPQQDAMDNIEVILKVAKFHEFEYLNSLISDLLLL